MNVKDVYGRTGFKYTCQVGNGGQGSDIPGFNADLERSHAGLRRFGTKRPKNVGRNGENPFGYGFT